MPKSMIRRGQSVAFAPLALTVICLVGFAGPTDIARGQDVILVDGVYQNPYRVRWGVYDPYYAVTSRIYAQAALIRAQGDAAVSFAHARELHADAYSKELDNWMKELRVYWDRKLVAEQKKLALDHVRQIKRMRYLNDQKWQNSRFWDRLKNHPELSEARIRNGDALNFFLARLATSSLPYEFVESSSRYAPDALRDLDLDEASLSNLTLKQGPLTFAADRSVDGTISLWPYILRWEDFDESRSRFETARIAVVEESESAGQVSMSRIQDLQQTLVSLTNEYHRSEKVKQWVKQHNRFSHFYSGDRFLQELDREIARLEDTGDIRPFRGQSGYDPEVDGDHVISLLCFMNRNGVEFAPAKPGSEFAYHRLFVLMRSLYLTVADEDDAVIPEDLGELAK